MPAPSDLVHETATTTGTGNFTLVNENGKRSFNTAFGNGAPTNVFDYYISHRSAAEWERGTGHMSAAATLVRDTVIASSNANAAVNFAAGTKDVTNDVPAAKQVKYDDTANNVNPVSSDGGALGTSALMWSDQFFASGAVVNYNNGDTTVTHVNGTGLTFSWSTGLRLLTISQTDSGGSTNVGIKVLHGGGTDSRITATASGIIWGNVSNHALRIDTNNTQRILIAATGQTDFLFAFGYGTAGAGGTVTQATSKSTGVTLNTQTGQITLNGAALAGDTTVSFTLTNDKIGANDLLILNHRSAGTAGSYTLNAQCAAGSASINVRNITTGSLSEAIVISYAIIRGVTT